MKRVILIGNETYLLSSIRKNYEKQIVTYNKYQFSNGNFINQFEEEFKHNKISIIADLSVKLHENLWGLFFTLDFLKNKNTIIEKLTFPYFPYSRSNHENENYTSGLFTMIGFLNKYKIDEIVTVDPHFEHQKLPFNHKFNVIKQEQIFENILNEKLKVNSLIIGPDKGSQQRVDSLRNKYKLNGFTLNKTRDGHNEKVDICVTDLQKKIIKNSDYISIFDDEICSGDTLKKVVDEIIKINPKIKVDIFISHLYISEEHFMELSKKINICYATNSVHSDIKNTKLKIIDLSPFILEQFNV